ncbi:MAG: AI-2E family transporter [Alphaproteobacteria bacterium]|nr:AI-2E family transporter [Alphaproteobacteria bacterium]
MNGLIIFLGILFLLFVGRALFVPLLIAGFLWYLINAIAAYYRKVMPFSRECKLTKFSHFISPVTCRIFDGVAFLLSLATFGGLVYAFTTQIRPMAQQLTMRLPEIQFKIHMLLNYLTGALGIAIDADRLPDLTRIAAYIGASAASMTMTLGLVLIYILFMFIEQSTFGKKLAALFPEKKQFGKMRFILASIDENMKKYMFMKTFISIATALCSYLWLRYMGIEFAGVWAFIIFLFNYIPTFGSILAVTLPILYSLAMSSTLNTPIMVALGLIALQIVFSNLLEPRLTGKTLNLSTLAILVNLVFWGMLWGIAGAFFSVPLLVATFIITAQFDRTRWIAVLLSANGEIPEKEED